MIIPESVTFEEAISITESMMAQTVDGTLSQTETAAAIAALVQTENGARGFFVTYLTSKGTLADNPSPEIIEALRSSPDTVAELLVKNLAMSVAMAITHRRDSNEEMARESDQVRSRTTHIIEEVELPQVRKLALALRESTVTGEGSYKAFLERWHYDAQQREVICQAIDRIIGCRESEMGNREAEMGNGEVEMANGEAEMGNGEVEMANGEAEMANGEAEMRNSEY